MAHNEQPLPIIVPTVDIVWRPGVFEYSEQPLPISVATYSSLGYPSVRTTSGGSETVGDNARHFLE